ncbi:protein arginine N-methyltransferase PRMT10 [Mercurialis annua]|uniref:protein arginine N-methyltransferase PRMT10 n=1 Tax=Mercurialis annua TaxID=3986 RepID=UPI00215EBA2E|nr:protein arginine N-methyltransferase PRMT10 [Mercurialis annua]
MLTCHSFLIPPLHTTKSPRRCPKTPLFKTARSESKTSKAEFYASMGSHRQHGGERSNGGATAVDKGVDFAQYFCTYSFLYHQKEMLSDRVRMDAYYNAIVRNKHHFHGKVVLDVGTGSGILAIWSAQAGARKVYAVEATKVAEHARVLVKANNVQDVVEIIEGSIEDITLPEKVDVIISEWMGYFLLRESMFDSVICARDRWLKPSGMMYPSHARMWMAPIRSGSGDQKKGDYNLAMDDWFNFVEDTKSEYGVDMTVLTQPFEQEQRKYYLQTSMWQNLYPNQVIGTAAIIKEIDCLTATVDDILNVKSNFMSVITMEGTRLSAFGGWFDVHFKGRGDDPAQQEIELTTAPSTDNGTHWGQQVFVVHPPIHTNVGDNLNVSFTMSRSKENHRLMEVELGCDVISKSSDKPPPPFKHKFYIE